MVDKKTAAQIRSDLRRRWRWSKQRREALARAFHHKEAYSVVITKGKNKGRKKLKYLEFYSCEKCACVVLRKLKQVDHIEPVVDPSVGFTTWDNYIDRLYVEAGKLMVLCLNCHKPKTKNENAKRRKAA